MATARVTLADDALHSINDTSSNLQASIYHSHHYRQPSNLPRYLYLALCIIFQVEISPTDRCVTGKIIFALATFISMAYGVIRVVFTVANIISEKTKETVTTGLFGILITLLWIALTVYANRLGRRILKSTTFVGSLRIHSKTVFKVPATLLLLVLGLCSITIEAYRAYKSYWGMKVCHDISLDGSFCRVLFVVQCVQTLLTLAFNICIAAAVLSICRTHTIGVRRFIRSLEKDGQVCELKHRQRFMKMQFAASHDLSEMYLPEQCYTHDSDADSIEGDDDKHFLITYVPETAGVSSVSEDTPTNATDGRQSTRQGTVLSKDDILFSFWKLSSRMRMTSRVIQRWTGSWITFTILWLLNWIFDWLSHPATFMEITLFILPLLMSVILCTAYGETNGETAKIVSCITPLQDRLEMIRTLPTVVIGMTVYNHVLEYTSIVTVVAAVGLALCSRMILDEFLPASTHS